MYLFPRELDYQSPLMRSYDYLSLIHNLFELPTSERAVKNIEISHKDSILWETKYLNYPDAVEVVEQISLNENNKLDERDL